MEESCLVPPLEPSLVLWASRWSPCSALACMTGYMACMKKTACRACMAGYRTQGGDWRGLDPKEEQFIWV